MTKYTINKVFEKTFPDPIWKIEVDSLNNTLAIETRNLENTIPLFHIFKFDGSTLLDNYLVEEKEWTLAAIQNNYLILKKVGVSTPIQAGIKIIDITQKKIHAQYAEYAIKDIYNNTIVGIHKSIPSGLLFYINLLSGNIQNTIPSDLQNIDNKVNYPESYKGKLPQFMSKLEKCENIWIQPYSKGFIWTYLEKNMNKYKLNLTLSTRDQPLTEKTIFNDFNTLILQPYFEVKEYIFFLSDTKQKIVTYLV